MVTNPLGEAKYDWLCSFLDGFFFDGKVKNLKSMKVGGFLTEFGSLANTENGVVELENVLKKTEEYY
jgi:hypothetical protein